MANQSVLELAVGTGKWDAGLKKAKSALDNFTQANGGLQQALDKESQKMQKFVQMMGGMESTAKTAKGQMNDYKSTIEQLTMQYNRMTEAQKKVIGQDYLQAIDQMKSKYQAVSKEIQEMNRSLNNVHLPDMKDGGGLFSGLGDKMSGALQVFGGNVMTKIAGMGVGLANEMADAVKQGIELARQGEGIRIAFERLGRGDILDGLREATHGTVTDLELMKAAVKFNDFKLPVEELGTMLAFAQQKAKDTGQSVDYMVDSIVTGLGRKSLMILDNLGLSANEVKEKMKETGDMTKAVGEIIREQMSKAGDYVETAADRAAQAHVSLQNKMEELGRKFSPLQEASNNFWTSMKIGILDIVGGPLTRLLNGLTEAGRLQNMLKNMNGEPGSGNTKVDQQLKKLNVIKKGGGSDYIFNSTLNGMMEDYNRQIAALDAKIKDTKNLSPDQQASKFVRDEVQKMSEQMKALGMMRDQLAAGAKELNKPIKIESNIPDVTGGGGRSGGKGGSNKEFDISKIAFTAAAGEKFDPSQYAKESGLRPENILGPSEEWEKYKDTITGSIGSIEESFSNLTEWTPNFDPYKENMDKLTESSRQQKIAFGLAAQAAQGFGAALSGIEDPAAKAAGTVVSAIASIALGFAMASSNPNTAGTGWGWLAWLGAGMSAMATTISTIHSLTGFQNGGMIKGYSTGGTIQGNSYSGDNIGGMVDGSQLVGLNAGELVLNKAQQATLAQNLQGGGNIRITGELHGESIALVLNRYFKRTGQGEIVTW